MNPYIFGAELLAFFLAIWFVMLFVSRRVARLIRTPIVQKLDEMTATFGLVPTASHVGRLDYDEKKFWVQHLRFQADQLEAQSDLEPDPSSGPRRM